MMVIPRLMVALLCAEGDRKAAKALGPVEMTISAKADKSGRWCAGPTFEATLNNSSAGPVWLDLSWPAGALVVTSYSVCYSNGQGGGCEGVHTGWTHDWGDIEKLRGPDATLLDPGESITRPVKLKDAHLKTGRATLDVSVRIHGTEDLRDAKVRTYTLEATEELRLRRVGRCFEVRRLTRR